MVERVLYAPGRRSLRALGDRVVLACEADEVSAIAAAHESIVSPHVARVLRTLDGSIELECDAVADLAEVVTHLGPEGRRVPYAFGVAFNEMMMDTLEAAHHAQGGPFCLGAMSWSNLLVGASGHLWMFGFGANFSTRLENGRLADGRGSVQAPEVLLGAEPTPASDVYLVHSMLKRLLAYVDVADELTRALAPATESSRELRHALVQLDRDVLDADPTTRPTSIAELRARYRAIRELTPSLPHADADGLRAFLAETAGTLATTKPVITYQLEQRMLTFAGEAIDLSRHPVLWRLFLALAHADAPMDPDALQEAIWPDEKIVPRAARNRLYVAIAGLRKAGLRTVLRKQETGYFLAATVEPGS